MLGGNRRTGLKGLKVIITPIPFGGFEIDRDGDEDQVRGLNNWHNNNNNNNDEHIRNSPTMAPSRAKPVLIFKPERK